MSKKTKEELFSRKKELKEKAGKEYDFFKQEYKNLSKEENNELDEIIEKLNTYDYKYGKLDKIKDNLSAKKIVIGSAIFATAVLAVGGLHHLAFFVSKYNSLQNDKLKIESNVEKVNNIGKFTGSAMTVSIKNGKFYLELFGTMIESSGKTPEFVSVNYEINEELYDKIHTYFDIEYEYGRDGQIIGAKNEYRILKPVIGLAQRDRAGWSAFKEVADVVTKNPYIKINYLGKTSSNEAQNSAINFTVREQMPDEITVDDIINEQITGKKSVVVDLEQ